ncbi:MAG: hypothetical protein LBT10_02230 [Methanobrevibacter sp.]|nr:hypothetical protein [Methanobrevibacter sp.]
MGGAIANAENRLIVRMSTFTDNIAKDGGAIFNLDSSLNVKGSTFINNIIVHDDENIKENYVSDRVNVKGSVFDLN